MREQTELERAKEEFKACFRCKHWSWIRYSQCLDCCDKSNFRLTEKYRKGVRDDK